MEVLDALHENGFRRWPEDGFILQILYQVKAVGVYFRLPDAGQFRLAIRRSGRRSRQVRFTVGGPGNPRRRKVEPLSAQRNGEKQ